MKNVMNRFKMRSTIVVMVAIFGLFGAILLASQSVNAQSLTCNNGGVYNSSETDIANIGNTISEDGRSLTNWTDWSEANIHGGYGQCLNGAVCDYRQIIEDPCTDNERTASVKLYAGSNKAHTLTIRHLDGVSLNDGFEVRVNGIKVGKWDDTTQIESEEWKIEKFFIESFNFTGDLNVELVATDTLWLPQCLTYGQVAIDWISLDTCSIPEPDPEIVNLIINKTVDLIEASPGDTLNYTIVVKNTGTANATDVVVNDVLPEGLIYQDGTTTKQWLYAVINHGDSKIINYVVIIEDDAVTNDYTNIASVSASEIFYDDDPAVTSVTEQVSIPIVLGEEALPSLTVDKTANVKFANPGDTITYTIIVTNDGDAMAIDTVLIDHIAAGMQFTDTVSPTHTWMLGDIAPGNSVTTTYDVIILRDNEPGIYRNTAEVWAQGVDNVFDTADVELRAVVVLGEELPVTGGSVMTFIYLIGAGLVITFSGLVLKLTAAKK